MSAVLPRLHRLAGDNEGIPAGGEPEGNRYQLAGPEIPAGVGEIGLDQDGAGGRIDLVVDKAEGPLCRPASVAGQPDLYRKGTFRQIALYRRQFPARDIEGDGNRGDAVDGHQRIIVIGLDQAALIGLDLPCAAVKRRCQGAELQFETGRVKGRLVSPDGGGQAGDLGCGLIGLFLGDIALPGGRQVALQFFFGVCQFGPVLGQHRLLRL